ncbi:hypothetical protein [Gracilibacillus sp. YIM 98692]|uniref:hypothetical protein n=1 Tax=Gracilibacillus sp. YIM 98692 TaxID=2663532 RepID=UPI0013D1ED32|nr:hypothetical protein [Gracilibacillus sp. YIM 98692]
MSQVEKIVERLQQRDPLPSLSPTEIWDKQLNKEIQSLSPEELTGRANASELAAQATKSGLLLWNDDLYGSHTLSQGISEPVGSYWHGIMHREEGDYGNAKYWFSNVGEHDIFPDLYNDATDILPEIKDWGKWNPSNFIDLVAEITSNGMEDSPKAEKLRRIQAIEFSLLLSYSRTL